MFEKFNDFYDEAKHRNAILGGGYGTPVNSELIAIAKRRQRFLMEGGKMSSSSYTVEAILKANDSGFSSAFKMLKNQYLVYLAWLLKLVQCLKVF